MVLKKRILGIENISAGITINIFGRYYNRNYNYNFRPKNNQRSHHTK